MAFTTATWVSVTDYSDAGMPMAVHGDSQELTPSGTQVDSTAAPTDTVGVRLATDTGIRFVVGTAAGTTPTVTGTTGAFMPSGAVEYVRIKPGCVVSIIQSS